MKGKLGAIVAVLLLVNNVMKAQIMKTYEAEWKQIDGYLQKGKSTTAQDATRKIFVAANKEKNVPQVIKAAMLLVGYRSVLIERSELTNHFFLDTLIAQSSGAAKAILQSLQAEHLYNYLQNNRWRFYNRTAIPQEKSTDIETWSIEKIYHTISQLYKASLKDAASLQALPSSVFEPIVIKGENTEELRPTVYDLLAHRALLFFSSRETQLTKPADNFALSHVKLYAPAEEFSKWKITTTDTTNNDYNATQLYQQLLSFRLKNNNMDALLDADLLRLQFVQQHSKIANGSELYIAALQRLANQYPKSKYSALAGVMIAEVIKTESKSTTHRVDNKRAVALCEAAIQKFPKSEAASRAINILNELKEKRLNVEHEKVWVANEPALALVSFKNITKAHLKLIKLSWEQKKQIDEWNSDGNKLLKKYLSFPVLRSWAVDLPAADDYVDHTTEIKVDALPLGYYLLLVSENEKFSDKNNIVAVSDFVVSNMMLVESENEFHVLHRITGEPVANALVKIEASYYDYDARKTEKKLVLNTKTNNNGYFNLPKTKGTDGDNGYYIELKNGDDVHAINNLHYIYNYYGNERVENRLETYMFTDRAIYRPGQSVYFKGLVTRKDSAGQYSVVPRHKATVTLHNANNEKVGQKEVITNEYGSYNGVFILPSAGLTGVYYLRVEKDGTYKNIRVEEYKRPKYKVEIEQPKLSYKIGDTVKLIGMAKAFAGNNIDGAKVKYRVVRTTQYRWWWLDYGYGRGGGRQEAPHQLTDGETTTDAEGKFYIEFKAMADAAANNDAKPMFNYEVYADVTDINGESHNVQYSLVLNYNAVQLNIVNTPTNGKQELLVETANSSGVHQDISIDVTIKAQLPPKEYLRNRLWEIPDMPLMDSATFKKYFPIDVYKYENKQENWSVSNTVFSQTLINKQGKAIPISPTLPAGYYVVEVTAKDKDGKTLQDIKYIQLEGAVNGFTNTLSIEGIKELYEPNEALTYNITTSFKKVFVIHERQFMSSRKDYIDNTNFTNKKGVHRTYERMRSGTLPHTVKLTEADRGGVVSSAFFVQQNRFFTVAKNVHIPWSNKDLSISFESFRDKTLPGSIEECKVKITGDKNTIVAAELLATMYDASLDQFAPHNLPLPTLYATIFNKHNWQASSSLASMQGDALVEYERTYGYFSKQYDALGVKLGDKKSKREAALWWLNPLDYAYGEASQQGVDLSVAEVRKTNATKMQRSMATPAAAPMLEQRAEADSVPNDDNGKTLYKKQMENQQTPQKKNEPNNIARKNFNETALFIPDAVTDAQGNIILKYTIPEALTEWKLLAMAHTKDMQRGVAEKKVITQKPIMVQPNLPRFVREGDKIQMPVKVVNLTDKEITGSAELALMNPETNTSVDGWFKNIYANQYFTVAAGQSTVVLFPIEIPFGYNKPLTIRTSAVSTQGTDLAVSDAEENILPVLTNRMLVTETMPLTMKPNSSKNFEFKKLVQNNSSTLTHQALTVEFTSNPVWYAVQALPYLMEYPFECAEQTFSRYYANTLATHIANKTPRIKEVFEKWKGDGKALQSALQRNEDLKNIVLAETPWVMEVQNEAAQKQKIALLFDLQKMATEQNAALNKLKELQTSNGGFMWFKGGRDDRFITQYILTGIGHLIKLNVLDADNKDMVRLVEKAIQYTDQRMKEDYDKLKDKSKFGFPSHYELNYLYMRSFFPNIPIATNATTAYNFYIKSVDKNWLQQSKYNQALIALVLHRNNKIANAKTIVASLKENAIINEELGMYWKDVRPGYYWYEAPTETMALMVELFNEVGNDVGAVLGLKTWLLKNKQTTNWKTTKATAEACYALLLQGDAWTTEHATVTLKLNNTPIAPTNAEPGTGYIKHQVVGDKVQEKMGNIAVAVSGSKSPSWGAAYWQYFENLDKITQAETPLSLKKKLYKQVITKTGIKLEEVADNAQLKIGDKLTVRIELRVDREMEYVHMKDMRSAGAEPLNVLSQYKWQDGLGYYEATKDASTNFFFSYLYKGTYIFEYPLYVTHKGSFSNGITTIQCMYAPEFTSHSEGVKVNVE